MEYLKMTKTEIREIVNKGGNELTELNEIVSEHLESLNLSQPAKNIIDDTDLNCIADVFGGLFTAEEVEEFVIDYVIDETLDDIIYIMSDKDDEKYIDSYINDSVRNKFPGYSKEQYNYICDEVEKRYKKL